MAHPKVVLLRVGRRIKSMEIKQSKATKRLDLKHHFLVAMPSLSNKGDTFAHSITYICEHSQEGAMGIIINQPMNQVTLPTIFKQLDIDHNPSNIFPAVLHGGPVNKQRGFVLHTGKGAWESSIHIADNIYLTASQDIIRALGARKGPDKSLFALGYAGWGAGQLEDEIAENHWLTLPAEEHIIFDTPSEERWLAAAKTIGVDMHLISPVAGNA